MAINKDNYDNKEIIRKEMIGRLRDQDPSVRLEKSLEIQKRVTTSKEFRFSRTIMSYVSLPTEVSTDYLNDEAMRQGKKVFVPFITGDKERIIASKLTSIEDLEEGPLGIRQPKKGGDNKAPIEQMDLIIVPGIAFGKDNMRLGRGKGYYDRLLSSDEGIFDKTIGLAYSFQIVKFLPFDPHDRSVSKVYTD